MPGDRGPDQLCPRNGLWNGQPFRVLSAVDMPVCSSGCARSEPLRVEKRVHILTGGQAEGGQGGARGALC